MKLNLKNIMKRCAVVALTFSLVVPAISSLSINTYAEDTASLIKSYDFNEGLREFHDDDGEYKIVSAGGQYIQKTAEEMESSDRADSNGFIIQGEKSEARYYTQSPGNQPSTKYDDEKGTVFFLAGTYNVPELVKELPANVAGDEVGSEILDANVPVGKVVREAATFKSAMTFTNPFKTLAGDNAVLAMWAKVPANSTEEKIGLVEFSDGSTSLSFCYDTAIAGLSTLGEWHYIVYVIGKDAVTAYVDGDETELKVLVDGTAPEDMIAFLKTSSIYLGATNTSTAVTVEETVIDDIAFYNGTMSYEDARTLYNNEKDEMNKSAVISEPLAFIAFDSEDAYTNINEENPSVIESFNINGHAVSGVAVVENVKGSTKNGIKIDNPLSGQDIEGATIGYWIQVEPKANIIDKNKVNDPTKSYTGKYPNEYIVNETVTLAFIDATKNIFNPKHGTSEDGFSYLYTKNRMEAYFEEGGCFDMNTGNLFEINSDEAKASEYTDESRNWHYMTYTINNNGIEIYCDGLKVDGLYLNQAPRFLDGYYRRVNQREQIYTQYGAFGGSGNQLANLITTFLTYEDTDMYFGWLPTMKGERNETTSPVNVSRMSVYDMDLDDADVRTLYEQELAAINELPVYSEEPDYIKGDLNADGTVDAADALIVLKIAAKLENITDDYLIRGDMDSNETLNAEDALAILKIAAKLN